MHEYLTEDAMVVIDYDQVAFQAASAVETKQIQAIHKASGNIKVFKNKTEFWGKGKAIGGWLGNLNEENLKKGKKT